MGTRKRIEQAEKSTLRMMYFSTDLVILPSLWTSQVVETRLHPLIT